ncbi:MAG: SIR2 family protein [Proteobacteria bacterium]|nr:SIR2 family protein [Pseudomonadota bacterium]
MPKTLEEKDWDTLLRRIKDGKCTPFLGAGACFGVLPLGSEIARKWAKEYDYPLCDINDLARVAQFLVVDRDDHMFPKEEIVRLFKDVAPPDFNEPGEPHGILADLPLPVYITTNYDDFMVRALKSRNKDPKQELCRWNKYIKSQPSIFASEPGFTPSPANPVVFHFHGYKEVPESLVLTEDDYLDFLVNISRDQALLPPRIQKALTGASLLFIGYRLADWNFRVLFRGLINSMEGSLRRLSVAVQLPPDASEPERLKAQSYLTEYFKNTDVRVYWGTARDFSTELKERWEKFKIEKRF